jgi:hypothetical protein
MAKETEEIMPLKVRIVQSYVWFHTQTGQRVSIYGACPWGSPSEQKYWEKRQVGWTVYNVNENTYGMCRPPFATKEGLEEYLRSHPDAFTIVP